MRFKELKDKTAEELNKILADFCMKRRDLNFKIANKQLKNVQEFKNVKKGIAYILTILNQRKKLN